MHFMVILTSRLETPMLVQDGPDKATGCTVVVGVNADGFLEAVRIGYEAAMSKVHHGAAGEEYTVLVEEAEIKQVSLDDWAEDVRQQFGDIASKGAYYTSGAAYFDHSDGGPVKRWWQFWR